MNAPRVVIDLDAWAMASAVYQARTGRLLTIDDYLALQRSAEHAPFLATVLAAEYARDNTDEQADQDAYREEMKLR